MTEYEKQAKAFLDKTHTEISISKMPFQKSPNWAKDGKHGIHYIVRISNLKGEYIFDYWGSILDRENMRHPSKYDILASLNGYPTITDYYDFCDEFGYKPSREVEEIHKEVLKQGKELHKLFSLDELELLQEIN